MGLLHTHPKLLLSGVELENPYYLEPNEFPAFREARSYCKWLKQAVKTWPHGVTLWGGVYRDRVRVGQHASGAEVTGIR